MRITTLDFCGSTYYDAATSGLIGIFNTLDTIDGGTCREIRRRNIFHQSLGVNVRVINIRTAAIDYLTQVVGRDIRCHTDGDTVTTINKEVRNLSRHDSRLLERIVEVVHHVDSILVQVVHDMLTHL